VRSSSFRRRPNNGTSNDRELGSNPCNCSPPGTRCSGTGLKDALGLLRELKREEFSSVADAVSAATPTPVVPTGPVNTASPAAEPVNTTALVIPPEVMDGAAFTSVDDRALFGYLRFKVRATPGGETREICGDTGAGCCLVDRNFLQGLNTLSPSPKEEEQLKASTSEGTTTALREIATWHFYVDGTNTTTVAPMKVKMNAKAWFVGHLEAGWLPFG